MDWLNAYLRAIEMAAIAHKDVRRKFVDEPYFVHPLRVSKTVLDYTGNFELACAAVLHDTLEDTDLKREEITSQFSGYVATLVESVTKDQSLVKADREKEFLSRFSAASDDTVIIKLADRLDNVNDLSRGVSTPLHFVTSYVRNTTELLKAVPERALENRTVGALHLLISGMVK